MKIDQGGLNPSGDLRVALDLYANIRPSRCYEGTRDLGGTLGTRAFGDAFVRRL